jgi:hypothetical protein
MTRDDIMRMARETDCLDDQHYGSVWADKLDRFANLIAAAEREACAELLDEMAAEDKLSNYYRVAALRIRERGAP